MLFRSAEQAEDSTIEHDDEALRDPDDGPRPAWATAHSRSSGMIRLCTRGRMLSLRVPGLSLHNTKAFYEGPKPR
jgi:hypothetical protein